MLILHVPTVDELRFRERMLADPQTMSYNRAWGGTISWPREKWQLWYDHWIAHPEKRFYRYLQDEETGDFVGEIAYHWDHEEDLYLADVIVYAPYRGKGFGRTGLRLLCRAARENGVSKLCDDMAADNPAIDLFLSEGFRIDAQREMTVLLKKELVPQEV